MTGALARQRCWAHSQREAVGRCLACHRFYCRECVTEHDGRLLCVQCLAGQAAANAALPGTRWLLWLAAAVLGFGVAFIWFYSTGYFLQQLPAAWVRGVDE